MTCRETGYGVLGLPKLCDMQGDWVPGCWAKREPPTPCSDTLYVSKSISCTCMCTYACMTCSSKLNSWLYLKITIIARTLYGGEKLHLSAKYDKNEADKLYSQWPSKSGLRVKCLFIILGRITKLTLFQNLTHAK